MLLRQKIPKLFSLSHQGKAGTPSDSGSNSDLQVSQFIHRIAFLEPMGEGLHVSIKTISILRCFILTLVDAF